MDQVTLSAQRRTESGTRPAKRMRREGLVPAVVYGAGLDTLHVAVQGRELYSALHTDAGANAIFNVEVEGGTTVLAVAREVQRHPVRGEITHLDFIQVRLDVKIEAEVGIEFIGEPEVVSQEGAIIETVSNSVMISALPTGIPSSIPVNIDHLELGGSRIPTLGRVARRR